MTTVFENVPIKKGVPNGIVRFLRQKGQYDLADMFFSSLEEGLPMGEPADPILHTEGLCYKSHKHNDMPCDTTFSDPFPCADGIWYKSYQHDVLPCVIKFFRPRDYFGHGYVSITEENSIWIKPYDPMPKLTFDIQDNSDDDPLYGLDKNMPNFLNEIGKRSIDYTLTYKFDSIPQFKVHVYKFLENDLPIVTINVNLYETVIDDTNDTKPAF
jgi:hypothetical protein